MEYIKDEYGKDLLFDSETKFQTMMEWERPYMDEYPVCIYEK